MTIAPGTLDVEIQYKVPEAIGAYSGSGTLSMAIKAVISAWLVRRYRLAKNGQFAGNSYRMSGLHGRMTGNMLPVFRLQLLGLSR